MEHVEYVYTFGMDESAVRTRLTESEAGVLSLAREGAAYAVPVSHHYGDGRLLIRLVDDGDSKKMSYLDSTEEACFLLYDVAAPGESWSIVVLGPLELAEDLSEAEINDRFGPVRVFDESIDDLAVSVYELKMESLTARQTEL